METRKLEPAAQTPQEEAIRNDYIPIWRYQKALQHKNKIDKRYMMRIKDGTIAKTIEERQARRTEWVVECFQISPGNLCPDI